jgi:hypothetical protein
MVVGGGGGWSEGATNGKIIFIWEKSGKIFSKTTD